MRLYTIKHKASGQFARGISWCQAHLKKDRKWFIEHESVPYYMESPNLNLYIEMLITRKLHNQLADYDLISYDTREPKQLNGGLTLDTIRNRLEAKAIIAALRA
jgi:hypothetical protein